VKDDKRRESDFVLHIGGEQIHIEVKHSENRPGTIFWSGLECEKAEELVRNSVKYLIAVLYPIDGRSYDIYWIWNPLDQLRRAARRVQWEGHSDYQHLKSDTWDVTDLWPPQVPTKRHTFRIGLTPEIMEEAKRDTEDLGALKQYIGS